MTIRPFTARKDFGTPQITINQTKSVDLSPLKAEITKLAQELDVMRKQAQQNTQGVRLLLGLHNWHWRLFDEAGDFALRDLAQMDAATRRSVYAKVKKSDAFTQEVEQQLTKKTFDEICSAAKTALKE